MGETGICPYLIQQAVFLVAVHPGFHGFLVNSEQNGSVSVCLSVETALVRGFPGDVNLWGLNFSGNVCVDQRLTFSILHSSSYFQIVSIRLLSLGK